MSVWMTALNASSNDISWTFPPEIKRKLISPQGTFDGVLTSGPAETNAVTIAPGAFVRREYISAVPGEIAGQVVLEFPGMDVNRTLLDVQSAASPSTNAPVRKP